MNVVAVKDQIVGAWRAKANALRGTVGLQIVYITKFGTAHAGDLRKTWRVPDEVRADTDVVSKVVAYVSDSLQAALEGNRPHPLLSCDDKELAAAFERLVKEPSFAKLDLTRWEFELAANAPNVFLEYGNFTWKQRKYLRLIVKKILEER